MVIDESHNFRNNDGFKDRETRYQRLMDSVIKAGVQTKALMLSATPLFAFIWSGLLSSAAVRSTSVDRRRGSSLARSTPLGRVRGREPRERKISLNQITRFACICTRRWPKN